MNIVRATSFIIICLFVYGKDTFGMENDQSTTINTVNNNSAPENNEDSFIQKLVKHTSQIISAITPTPEYQEALRSIIQNHFLHLMFETSFVSHVGSLADEISLGAALRARSGI